MKFPVAIILLSFLLLILPKAHSQEPKVEFGAYLDTYYSYDFSKPNDNRLYVTQYDRHNEFNLGHAILSGKYQDDNVRANLGLQIGTYPANNYSAEPEKLYQHIYEAFAGYRIAENGWLDIGVFGGHFGYESALAIERELYSPALATEYTPYYQSGIRYTHQLSQNTEVRAVLLNGWQNIGETNESKSVGIGIDHKFSDKISVSYGNYYGNEQTDGGSGIMRFHNNLVINTNPIENLSLIGVIDHTSQNNRDENVLFVTAISEYQLYEKWLVAARYEYVQDLDEILITSVTGNFEMNIYSLALNHHASESAVFKLEGKLYRSPEDNFDGKLGVGPASIVLNVGMVVKLN